jgi:hypothetical protein
MQRWSVIKKFAEDVSDERAIDAFSAGLRRSDLVEEIGRIKPRTVSELMEIANRFAEIKRIRSGNYSSNNFQDSNKRKSTKSKNIGLSPKSAFL